MCRNIKPLFNVEPPTTEDEIRAAAVQFVRKVSGFTTPSKANEVAFRAAVDEIAAASRKLLNSLETRAPSRKRAEEAVPVRQTPRINRRREHHNTAQHVNKERGHDDTTTHA